MSFIGMRMAEGRRRRGGSTLPAACRPMPACSDGFTLVEMLVVMGIIILAVAMAVPAIRALTGTNSEQAAQNTIGAYIASVRTDAIRIQQPRGVVFMLDKATDRITLAELMQSPPLTTDRLGGVMLLDLATDRDPLPLPAGVRVWAILDPYFPPPMIYPNPIGKVTQAAPFGNYRYLGFNNTYTTSMPTPDRATIGGVIMFDGQGQLMVTRYGFRFSISTVGTALLTALYTSPPSSPTAFWPVLSPSADPYLRTQVGFVLFNKDAFQNQQTGANRDSNTAGLETTLDPWLDVNTTPILVTRFNGTLTRAE